MSKPERNTLEYAAYKAQKRAHRDAKKTHQREAETENPDLGGEGRSASLPVSNTHHRGHHHHGRSRRRRRVRGSDDDDDDGDDDDDDEGEYYSYSETSDGERVSEASRRGGGGKPHRKSRSRAGVEESPSRRRRGSASPRGSRGAPSSSRGRERSGSDVAFGGGPTYGANANTSFGYGPSPINVGGEGYGGGRRYGEDSRYSPVSPPTTAPGSPYPAAGPYGSEQPGSQLPLSPGAYAQDYPQNLGTSPGGSYYSAPPPATTYASTLPTPQRYPDDARSPPDGDQFSPPLPGGQYPPPGGGQYSAPPPSSGQYSAPPPPGGGQYPAPPPGGGQYSAPPPPGGDQYPAPPLPGGDQDPAPPPPSGDQYPPTPSGGQYPAPPPPDGGQYPPSLPPGPSLTDKFTPGQGKAALQSMTATPSVFHYQTDGPNLGTTPAPYSGDTKLDPNYPGALPSGGAGNAAYPPSQAPPQYNNPDYYSNASRGLAEPQRFSEPNSTGAGLTGKSVNLGLTIPGPGAGGGGGYGPGERPPPSPALQPYYGTYQSISPLPSPTFPASRSPLLEASGSVSAGKHSASGSFSLGPSAYPSSKKQDKPAHYQSSSSISSFQEVSHTTTHHGGGRHSGRDDSYSPSSRSSMSPARSRSPSPERRSYNPTSDAKTILEELKHTFTRPSPRPLINILPTLSPRDLQSLRREYKSLYRGVNLAKHIKSVFTTSSPFGKVVFAVALGPYESEAWFANSWYQRKETRNELLIEALMGKSNSEIASIKAAFRDAKYDSSLEKAVSDELPANKFRIAVMAQLSCSRMEEDRPLVAEGIREDVARLGSILERGSAGGGETEMVGIIVNRSDRWLREVAALYRQIYDKDLAKAIMRHSKNLVVSLSSPFLARKT
jgi:hypothetical protein